MATLRSCTLRSVTSRKSVIFVVVSGKAHNCDPAPAPPRAARPNVMPFVLAAASTLLSSSPVLASETSDLFTNKCAGCHMNGGNVLAVGATLFPEDLRRNGVDSTEALYDIIYRGKGKMPGFGKDCAPRGACTFGPRLTNEEVAALATFVGERADAGWKS